MKRTTIIVFLVAVPCALLTMAVIKRLSNPANQPEVNKQHLDMAASAVANRWADYAYVEVQNPAFPDRIREMATSVPLNGQLSSEQQSQLADRLMVFFHAFSDGTYESYKAFRMPAGVPFTWTANKFGTLDQVLANGPRFGSPKALDRWYASYKGRGIDWASLSMDEKFLMYLKLYSGDTVFTNYFEAVCFDRSRLVVQQLTNGITDVNDTVFFADSGPLSATSGFPNIGYYRQKQRTLIKFQEPIEALQGRLGSVTVADCFFFVQRPQPDPILPVIVRFYWNPERARWLPDDLVVGNMWEKGDRWPLF